MEAETGVIHLQAKGCRGLRARREAWVASPSGPPGGTILPAPHCWTSGLLHCCVEPPRFGMIGYSSPRKRIQKERADEISERPSEAEHGSQWEGGGG